MIDVFLRGDFPEKYNWSVDYEVGVPLIDAQHKKLFLIFKNLVNACKAQRPVNGGGQALELMVDYVDYHFKAEELFWELEATIYVPHRKAHYFFVKEIYVATGNVRMREDISEELLSFLATWLLEHVLGMDRLHFQKLRDLGLLDDNGFMLKK